MTTATSRCWRFIASAETARVDPSLQRRPRWKLKPRTTYRCMYYVHVRHSTARLPHPYRGAIKRKRIAPLPLRTQPPCGEGRGRQLGTLELTLRNKTQAVSPTLAAVYPRFRRGRPGVSTCFTSLFCRRNICRRGPKPPSHCHPRIPVFCWRFFRFRNLTGAARYSKPCGLLDAFV